MSDEKKTKEELLAELHTLREQVAGLTNDGGDAEDAHREPSFAGGVTRREAMAVWIAPVILSIPLSSQAAAQGGSERLGGFPTPMPTSFPTVMPSIAPSIMPTSHPTYTPTHSPIMSPTLFPTLSPTAPTLFPTFSPTLPPPTLSPTPVPTASPTPTADRIFDDGFESGDTLEWSNSTG